MTHRELKRIVSRYRGVHALDRALSHRSRRFLKRLFTFLTVVLGVLYSGILMPPAAALSGVFFLVVVIWLVLIALDAFYYSYAYEDRSPFPFAFELGGILAKTKDNDLTGGFARSPIGRHILLRLGISQSGTDEFLAKRTSFIRSDAISLSDEHPLEDYFRSLVRLDTAFAHFLLAHDASEEVFVKGALWTLRMKRRRESAERFWSRENLEAIPSLGRDWAYGKAYTLMRFSTPLRFSRYQHNELHQEEALRVEGVLTRGAGANVVLAGEEGAGKMEVLEALARRIMRRHAPRALHDKYFFVLDAEGIAAEKKIRSDFEETILEVVAEAAHAGNIIMVIPDLANFIRIGTSYGTDVVELLARFLASSAIQIVAISDTDAFHRTGERNRELLQHFEVVQVPEGDEQSILLSLEDMIRGLEIRFGAFFTYPALNEALLASRRFFPDRALYDTLSDILADAASSVSKEDPVVFRDEVLALVERKTGVPTGAPHADEKHLLENLEALLHERVVGQDEAITAVSRALRRSRLGVADHRRPSGSFLFLGPTGVGKTETAKALSEIFFGPDVPLMRLDMSEYHTADSIHRLIGGFEAETPGILASMLRDQQYGVLLLDEFEKTDSRVLDLFLQILDEGMFSDALGRSVSARSLLIIATSNAGGELLFSAAKRGKKLQEKEVVEKVVEDGIFKPELLNRFDDVVLFHALDDAELKAVAKILLKRLAFRLKEKGIDFAVNDAVVTFIASYGNDPEFGARPLARAIQDTVESLIAERMLKGVYAPGSRVELNSRDLQTFS